jgi:hypothetical protein
MPQPVPPAGVFRSRSGQMCSGVLSFRRPRGCRLRREVRSVARLGAAPSENPTDPHRFIAAPNPQPKYRSQMRRSPPKSSQPLHHDARPSDSGQEHNGETTKGSSGSFATQSWPGFSSMPTAARTKSPTIRSAMTEIAKMISSMLRSRSGTQDKPDGWRDVADQGHCRLSGC